MRISDWSSDVCSSDLIAGDAETRGCGVDQECRQAIPDTGRPVRIGVDGDELRLVRIGNEHLPAAQNPSVTIANGAGLDRGHIGAAIRFRQREGNGTLAADHGRQPALLLRRSEEHTSELQSLMRISYAVFCW